jgi:hypothetical protein
VLQRQAEAAERNCSERMRAMFPPELPAKPAGPKLEPNALAEPNCCTEYVNLPTQVPFSSQSLITDELKPASPRIRRKLIPASPHEIHDQPDQSDENQQWSEWKQHPHPVGKHHARAVNHCAGRKIRISARNRDIAPHRGSFRQIQVRAQRRQIATNFMTRINLNPAEHHRNVPSHISMDVNRTEHARNITRRLTFGDRNVTANTGPVL